MPTAVPPDDAKRNRGEVGGVRERSFKLLSLKYIPFAKKYIKMYNHVNITRVFPGAWKVV